MGSALPQFAANGRLFVHQTMPLKEPRVRNTIEHPQLAAARVVAPDDALAVVARLFGWIVHAATLFRRSNGGCVGDGGAPRPARPLHGLAHGVNNLIEVVRLSYDLEELDGGGNLLENTFHVAGREHPRKVFQESCCT